MSHKQPDKRDDMAAMCWPVLWPNRPPNVTIGERQAKNRNTIEAMHRKDCILEVRSVPPQVETDWLPRDLPLHVFDEATKAPSGSYESSLF
jgi:hypothetical protein